MPPLRDARVVHEDVDAAEILFHVGREARDPVEIGEVDRPRLGVRRVLAHAGERLVESVGAAGADPNHRASLGEARCERGTDS